MANAGKSTDEGVRTLAQDGVESSQARVASTPGPAAVDGEAARVDDPGTPAGSPPGTAPRRGRFSVPDRADSVPRSSRSRARRRAAIATVALALLAGATWGVLAGGDQRAARVLAAGRRVFAAATGRLAAFTADVSRELRGLVHPRVPDSPADGPAGDGPPAPPGDARSRLPVPRDDAALQPDVLPAPGGASHNIAGITRGVRWGMTVQDLLAAVPSALPVAEGGAARTGESPRVRVERIKVHGRVFRADYLFDRSGRLGAIQLQLASESRSGEAYDDLVSALSAELGRPVLEPEERSRTGPWDRSVSWITRGARVDLHGWERGVGAARVFAVDMQRGSIWPMDEGSVVLTLLDPSSVEPPADGP